MPEPGRVTVLAHVSDLHLDGSAQAHARAARAAAYLASVAGGLDGVLVSGDISDRGGAADYAAARELFGTLPVPAFFAPGNHDERTAFAAVLLDRPGQQPGEPLDQLREVGGVRLAVLDSVDPGEAHGCLQPRTLAWLDDTLGAAPGIPALVALHHPPVTLGLPAIDPIRLLDAAGLARVVARHPHAAAILCGHAHSAAASSFAGRPVRVAPGVRSAAVLPWEARPQMMRHDVPVGMSFHVVRDGEVTTHVRYLADGMNNGRDEQESRR